MKKLILGKNSPKIVILGKKWILVKNTQDDKIKT